MWVHLGEEGQNSATMLLEIIEQLKYEMAHFRTKNEILMRD